MLYLIGLGLGDEKDITIKGAEAIRASDLVFLEMYTSVLGVSAEKLSETYGKEVVIADRELVESLAEERILEPAKTKVVSFLVVGDALCATTHTDLAVRALDMGIDVRVIHNASIMNAIGSAGLQLYNYGQTVSIPFFTESWRPDSFYDKIAFNKRGNLHTLCLLDIKVKEPDFDAMMRGKKKFLPPRFMLVHEAVDQLLEIEERRGEHVLSEETMAIGVARVGQPTQQIVSGALKELRTADLGGPLHSLIILGGEEGKQRELLHDIEVLMYERFRSGSGKASVQAAPADILAGSTPAATETTTETAAASGGGGGGGGGSSEEGR